MKAYMKARAMTQEFIDDFLGYFMDPTNKHMCVRRYYVRDGWKYLAGSGRRKLHGSSAGGECGGKWRFDGWTDSDNRKPVTGAAVRSGRGII